MYRLFETYKKTIVSLFKTIISMRKPHWFQWSLFPKDGNLPKQLIFKNIFYLIAFVGLYWLFMQFNSIPYSIISISTDKLNNARYVSRSLMKDSTCYLHYQRANLLLQITRTTIEEKKKDTIDILECKVFSDSMQIYDLRSTGDSTNTLFQLTPYWYAIYSLTPYMGQKRQQKNTREHAFPWDDPSYNEDYRPQLDYYHDAIFENKVKSIQNTIWENRHFFIYSLIHQIHGNTEIPDPLSKTNKIKEWYRYKISSSLTYREAKVDTLWHDSLEKNQNDKIRNYYISRNGIEQLHGKKHLYAELYQGCNHGCGQFLFNVYNSSSIHKHIDVEPPSWLDLHDISQGWYQIHLNTATIDSVELTIDFVGATEFYPMKVKPDEIESNYIKFSDPMKILQIKKEGITFYAKFKELENLQTIRCFVVTALLSGLLIILLNYTIKIIYRVLRIVCFLLLRKRN